MADVQMHHDGPFLDGSIGRPRSYFEQRGCSIDCRGPTRISATANFGMRVHTYSLSHDPARYDQDAVGREVVIDDHAWIGSDAVLYNCHIGQGAVVSVGTVVRSRDVPPWTMVEGNPPVIIARYDQEAQKWVYLDAPEQVPMTKNWRQEHE